MDSKGIEGTALLHNWHVSTLCMYLHLGHLLMKQLELATSRLVYRPYSWLCYCTSYASAANYGGKPFLFLYVHTVYTCTVLL